MRHLLTVLLMLPLGASAAEATPDKAVSALWRALSNEPGGRADAAALARIFHEDAVIFGGRYKEGSPVLRRTSGAEFLKAYGPVQEKGFHECEVARTLHVYDRFAVAYSVVESRADKASPGADFVGVNSVQLYKVDAQWKIVSLYYHVERPGVPIPLDGGKSGKCLG